MTTIMKQIKLAVESSGITQSELSEKCGVTETSVSRWLNGTRDPKTADMEKMAGALGMRIYLCKSNEAHSDTDQMYSLKTIKKMIWTLFEALNDVK